MQRVFRVTYHAYDNACCITTTFLLRCSERSAKRYVDQHLGILESILDVTFAFSFDYGKIRECLIYSLPYEDVEVIMNVLKDSKLFDLS